MDKPIELILPVDIYGILNEDGQFLRGPGLGWSNDISKGVLWEPIHRDFLIGKIKRGVRRGSPTFVGNETAQVVKIKAIILEVVEPGFSFVDWLETVTEMNPNVQPKGKREPN